MKNYGLHWFRRDLRVAGNKALQKQLSENNGRVVGIFCFDKEFLSRDDFSVNRFQLFMNSILELQKELRELGSDLLVLDEGPKSLLPKILEDLKKKTGAYPSLVSWNRDYEPFARERDEFISEMLKDKSIAFETFRDHLIIEPHELEKAPGKGGYQVYSPFARKWLSILHQPEMRKRVHSQQKGLDYLESRLKAKASKKLFSLSWDEIGLKKYKDSLQNYIKENAKKVDIEIPDSGSLAAYKVLKDFTSKLDNYKEDRDIPSLFGTSRLSMHLKNGSITTAQIAQYLDLKIYTKKTNSQDTFFSELIWREFYYHILYRNPHVEKLEFLEKYRDLSWENNKKHFEAWKEGRTGFPIIDAGMRELNQTGWMHNRVRMIVASFLTKDLLIDWRWGEKYFMDKLLDGDLAPNNGGWQWAASTGCDPQPYFRIFNPWSQSKKFDPKGEYIRKYIPELDNIDTKKLHEPILHHVKYPEPIVDHKEQREKALALYKSQG